MFPSHDGSGTTRGALALGFCSHLISGVFPFFASVAIAAYGVYTGTAILYVTGIPILFGYAVIRARKEGSRGLGIMPELRMIAAGGFSLQCVVGLVAFAIGGITYYIGLSSSPRVAEFIFLTRLDWVLQVPVAVVILREPWTWISLFGGGIALLGGGIISWNGSLGSTALLAALLYVSVSIVGYSLFSRITRARGEGSAFVLAFVRHLVNGTLLGFLAGSSLLDVGLGAFADGWLLGGGVLLVAMFVLRFTALVGLPLWALSVQSPIQALIVVGVTVIGGSAIPPAVLFAVGLIVVGEILVTQYRPEKAVVLGRKPRAVEA